MPPKKKSNVVHAQIASPVLIRKTLLEASISSIENLKILKNIRQIKKRKDKLKVELRRLMKEINDSGVYFRDLLPNPEDVGIVPEKETEKEIKVTKKIEVKKRKKQEKLMAKTTQKNGNPFEQRDELDFDIDKLKEKIGQL